MKLQRVTVATATLGQNIMCLPLDPNTLAFSDAIYLYGSKSTSGITCSVQGTSADIWGTIPVTISQTLTTVTVTFIGVPGHQLTSSACYVNIMGTGDIGVDGIYQVATVTSPTVLTYTSAVSQTAAYTAAFAVPVPVTQGVIASGSVSATVPKQPVVTVASPFYSLPYSCLLLICTARTAGTAYLDVRQSGATN